MAANNLNTSEQRGHLSIILYSMLKSKKPIFIAKFEMIVNIEIALWR